MGPRRPLRKTPGVGGDGQGESVERVAGRAG